MTRSLASLCGRERARYLLYAFACCVVSCGRAPSGGDTVARAIRDYERGLKDRNVKLVCSRIFRSTDLPVALAKQWDEATPSGSPAAWRLHNADCLARFGQHGEFNAATGHFSIVQVKHQAVPEMQGIDRTATAVTKFTQRRRVFPETVHLVRFRHSWKLVIRAE